MRPDPIPDRIPNRIQTVIAVLVLVLQGCGHKGPLMLPAPQTQTSPAQVSGAQTPQGQTTSPQKPDLPSSQQNPSTK
ncbi:MAG: lipoprotein [Gallionella sp.]